MTASQISHLIKLCIQSYDRKEIGIETLSSLVRALRTQAEAQGLTDELNRLTPGV